MGMIEEEVIRRLFRIQVAQPSPQYRNIQTNVDEQDQMGLRQQTTTSTPRPTAPGGGKKVGRNDPCPCGKIDPKTGKPIKYKKCCYPKYG